MNDKPVSAARMARDQLGRSPAWFSQHKAELEAAGFPKPLPVLGTYRPSAVQAWLDSQAGTGAQSRGSGLAGRFQNGRGKNERSAA